MASFEIAINLYPVKRIKITLSICTNLKKLVLEEQFHIKLEGKLKMGTNISSCERINHNMFTNQ